MPNDDDDVLWGGQSNEEDHNDDSEDDDANNRARNLSQLCIHFSILGQTRIRTPYISDVMLDFVLTRL